MTYPIADCILDMLHSSGPQELPDMRRECFVQAVPYSKEEFYRTVAKLMRDKRITFHPQGRDSYFDLPETYYNAQVGIHQGASA